MKKLLVMIITLSSVSSFADQLPTMNCIKKVMEMNSVKKDGKAIPKNDFYHAAKIRARMEFRTATQLSKKFESVYYINSDKNAVIAICDDVTGYEQGDCYEYYFNKKNDHVNLLAIAEMPHIGKDKVNFLCEGE